MMSDDTGELPKGVVMYLEACRRQVHKAQDNVAAALHCKCPEEWAGRIGFVMADLLNAQQATADALRWLADHVRTQA
jgi:hypothetical protein